MVLTDDIKVSNQEPFYAIKAAGKWTFLRDFLQPHEIGTALIEVERLRRHDAEEHLPMDADTAMNKAKAAIILSRKATPETQLRNLMDAGVLIANAIEHIIKNAK